MRDPRLEKLAHLLVTYSVGVKKGDLVRIAASPVAELLVVELYRQVLLAGAHPFVRMPPEACAELMFELGSDEQLRFLSPIDRFEMERVDCSIGVWADENTKSLTGADPAKQALRSQARKPIMDTFMKRAATKELRWTGTQFPCQAAAQDAEMSLAHYEEFVFTAGLLHLDDPAAAWREISQRQQHVCDYLNRTKEVRFVTPAGTDLRLGVEGRTWINCDGHENFPDGEVFTGPIEDATEGTVAFSFPAVHHGREVTDVRLVFKAGKVVEASASKGEEFLIAMLDQDPGARILGEVAIGCNYAVKQYTKNTLFDEKIGGTFHAALGASYPESGGKNQSGLHWDMVCDLRHGGRIEADGKLISTDGRFLDAAWPRPVE